MNNREKLLDEALTLFAARTYDAVGVQEIVEAANVTKPTLYHYFKSKHGLLQTLIDERGAVLLDEVRQAAVYQRDITLNLMQLVYTYFAYAEGHRRFYRLMLALWFSPPGSEPFEAVRTLQSAQYDLIEAMFKAAADDHGNMRGKHAQLAVSFKGIIDTYIGLSLQGLFTLDQAQTYPIVHQFMHGIFS